MTPGALEDLCRVLGGAYGPDMTILVTGATGNVGGALEGADGVFLMSGHDGMTELLRRARDAGVRRAVLLSGSAVAADDLDNAVSRYQAQAEADVRASGLEWTFLRPNSFMTNALEWAEQLRAGDVVRAPFGGVRVAMIDPADIAAVAAHALVEDGLGGRALRLSGPDSLAPGDRVRILGEVLGRDLRYEAQSDPTPPRRCTRRCPPPTPRRS